jgi:glycosyltransferase involved in cell wall biosynthesis
VPGLRILQILRAPVGGLFRHVFDLTQELAARGHQIGIIADSLHTDALSAQRLGQLAPYAALGVHSLPIPRVLGLNDLTTPAKVRNLAKRLGANVLHGHGAKGGFIARLARLGTSDRVALYTPHGGVLHYLPSSPTGMTFGLIERSLAGVTDAFIFESAFAKGAFGRQILEPAAPAPIVYNGLMPSEFEPVPLDADAADFAFIGEFRAIKGITELLDALVYLKRPDGKPATLAMAGGGPDFEETKARIATTGLADRVRLLGVTPARLAMAKGHCVVVPSLAESLPYVVLEAAAAGRPVIATRVGGVAEIFGPTATSLVPAGDSAALAEAMQRVLDNPSVALAEVEIRSAHIRQHFSVGRMADQIEALYHQALSGRRN